jgi:superfamily II RNA helicase
VSGPQGGPRKAKKPRTFRRRRGRAGARAEEPRAAASDAPERDDEPAPPPPRAPEPEPEDGWVAPPGARTHWRGFRLSPFQVRALEAVRAGRNVLVGAPTGAGKTLVAEYALHDALQRGRRCVYTAPIKTLSNQKYRDFREEGGLDVGLMTGDVTLQPAAQILIMTTEILRNAIFENPAGLADVEYAIFDEVHFLDDPERGSVWEEALIFAPPSMRFICLSATVANIEELGAWLREVRPHELEVIQSSRRPVPLHHQVWSPRLGRLEPGELARARRGAQSRQERAREEERRRGGRRRGGRPARPRFEAPDPSLLFDELQAHGLLPALVFAFSRRDCERLARRNEGRALLSPAELESMEELQSKLIELFRLSPRARHGEVFTLARNGIGFHHAGLLPVHKELVERMFTSGLLKLLFTTETFALGINMPARTVVFHGLEKFDGVSMDWLRTRDYLQMAGRAGRQGIDSEGLVISLAGDRELSEAPFERLLAGVPEPVMSRFTLSYSSLLHLIEALGRERLAEAWEKSFHLFQERGSRPKARARLAERHARLAEARLGLLAELGYITADDRLTGRGRIARLITGYELQVTELLFRGTIENLGPVDLATVFVGLVYEERRRGGGSFVPARFSGELRREVGRFLAGVAGREATWGIPQPMKLPDWGLSAVVAAWCAGADFESLEDLVDIPAGDLVRSLRMAVQLMRQVRRAIDPDWDLFDRLQDAIATVDRDEVDARAQLELG